MASRIRTSNRYFMSVPPMSLSFRAIVRMPLAKPGDFERRRSRIQTVYQPEQVEFQSFCRPGEHSEHPTQRKLKSLTTGQSALPGSIRIILADGVAG